MTRQVTTLPVTEKSVANGNWDTTRAPIDRIIIHTMVGTATSADARFNNSTSKVSAHYGVLLDGSIWHWVDEDNTAYQAGNYAMNQRSIGIEHEDNGDYNGVRPDVLYATSAKLVKDICGFYGIPIDRTHILKHSEVIATGCPDALDIDRIVREAAGQGVDTCPADRDKNWNIATKMAAAVGLSLNPADKDGSSDAVVQAIHDLQDKVAALSHPTTPPTPSQPSSPSAPTPGTDYKPYLVSIKGVLYGPKPWWNQYLHDARITKIGALVTASGV